MPLISNLHGKSVIINSELCIDGSCNFLGPFAMSSATIGNIGISGNTIFSIPVNTNINIIPNGSGKVILNANPTVPLQAATKDYVDIQNANTITYVDSQITSTVTSLTSYVDSQILDSFHLDYAFVGTVDSSSYTVVSTILLTDHSNNITSAKVVAKMDSGPSSYDLRLVDFTNVSVLASSSGHVNLVNDIIDLGTLTGVSTSDSILELQARRIGGSPGDLVTVSALHLT